MDWIYEEHYEQDMQERAVPYVMARMTSGWDERVEGQKIYYEYYHADNPRAVIVLQHGFTESVRKYTESVYYMLQAGFDVWGMDARGHGKSCRHTDNPYVVHVLHFEDYVQDLVHLTETKVKPASRGLPLYIYGHSMGGCISTLTIQEHPDLFEKAVLSSPMLGLSFGALPPSVVYSAGFVMGIPSHRRNPLSPVTSFQTEPDFEGSCDSSLCRYLYYHQRRVKDPQLQTSTSSIGWGMEAIHACRRAVKKANTDKIRIPVLLMQAGNDTVVKNESQNLFASQVKTCQLSVVPGMKHELFMTDSPVLIPYWEKIFSFLNA